MPNEGPYGGKIVINEDGTVEWQAAARSFPKTQDVEGTLQYAVRVTTPDRAIVASGDGKCIVHTHPVQGQRFNATSGALSAVLIVSGYEEPDEEEGAVVVGRSYFVTGAYRDDQDRRSSVMPCYDVHLKYDDYDLDRANAQIAHLGQQVAESKLDFCYQRWVSVRFIQEQLKDPHNVETHLRHMGLPARTLNQLPMTLGNNGNADIWLSFWNRVQPSSTSRCNPTAHVSAMVDARSPVAEPQPRRQNDVIEGLTIDGLIVCGDRVSDIPGSRTVIVKGIDRPGTFALMYHWKRHTSGHSTPVQPISEVAEH